MRDAEYVSECGHNFGLSITDKVKYTEMRVCRTIIISDLFPAPEEILHNVIILAACSLCFSYVYENERNVRLHELYV